MKNPAAYIAFRYLRSPKSHSVINMISWVALVALTVPTAALMVILSLHNGLSDTIEKLYNSFDSELRITARDGKYFDPKTIQINSIEGVAAVSYTIEDNVLLRKGEREFLATVKGVDSSYRHVVPIENLISHGTYQPMLGELPQAIVGQGIAYNLGINPSLIQHIDIYSILPDRGASVFQTEIFNQRSITPVGVYALDEQTDSKYIIVPLAFAQDLLGFSGMVSSAEILLDKGADVEAIKSQVPAEFNAQSRYEQKESLYKAINQEKWIIYLLLMMVLVIASLSLAGSIVVLIADKRQQIETLRNMGATTKLVRSIFRIQGFAIVVIGSVVGVVIGTIFSLLQQHYGFISMAGSSMILDAYPVRVVLLDIVVILGGVWLVGWLISTIAVRTAIKNI